MMCDQRTINKAWKRDDIVISLSYVVTEQDALGYHLSRRQTTTSWHSTGARAMENKGVLKAKQGTSQ